MIYAYNVFYMCWKKGITSTTIILPILRILHCSWMFEPQRIRFDQSGKYAREVPLNLGGEVGWHVPKSHVADVSRRSEKKEPREPSVVY